MTYDRMDLASLLAKYEIAGVHPAAELLPMMTDDEFQSLCADVDSQGFLHPVRVDNDGLLIDGRNRLQVAWAISLDPIIEHYQPVDTVAYVISENVERRHLTTGQRAILGEKIANLPNGLKEGSASALASSLTSQNAAAAQVNVSPDAIKKIKFIKRWAPHLVDAVNADTMSLEAAFQQAKGAREQWLEDNPPPEPKAKPDQVILTLYTHTGDPVPYPQPQGKHTFNQTTEAVDWARYTWNPVTGCLHGCGYCYARDLALKEGYQASYPVGFTPLFHTERLGDPVNTKIPAQAAGDPRWGRVFVGSMTDLFGEWVPKDWIDAVFDAANAAPEWEYLFLTKFPQRYRRIGLPPSCWYGTSVDTQKRVKTAEKAMKDLDVKVRWLSIEPLLEPIEFSDLSWCNLMVIGAQTGTQQPNGYVPGFAPDFRWVASLVAQADAAGVPVYLKPNLIGKTSDQSPGMTLPQELPSIITG